MSDTAVSDEVYALLMDCQSALERAEEGLRSCYQVVDYPANGCSDQDHALASVRGTLGRLSNLLGSR